ncbi:Uncharacterised protein [Vibrio cholerae]|nr:Uncharacterised protein [Vibrio cholerae]CSB24571.1 Uncharacterised protein [Vibrio cholerae]CSB25987.1 Uncharacterised protein [Vibrio cholerae]CSB36247.1 Uncharacterised protein [Vibrio cholerae]CSB38586.1 Uncharacterised protein [Vibrio cholerae]
MPAPKFTPVAPKMATMPPVIYSQALSPAPSITAIVPELRTAKRSPALPAANSLPPVAPYKQVLPIMVASLHTKAVPWWGRITILPPAMPLPT